MRRKARVLGELGEWQRFVEVLLDVDEHSQQPLFVLAQGDWLHRNDTQIYSRTEIGMLDRSCGNEVRVARRRSDRITSVPRDSWELRKVLPKSRAVFVVASASGSAVFFRVRRSDNIYGERGVG
jgi:hypothetical protein